MFKYEEKAGVIHLAHGLYICWVDSCEKQMKNSIGKPYEGKLHVRFDEGGADSLLEIITFMFNNLSGLSGSTLLHNIKKHPNK